MVKSLIENIFEESTFGQLCSLEVITSITHAQKRIVQGLYSLILTPYGGIYCSMIIITRKAFPNYLLPAQK